MLNCVSELICGFFLDGGVIVNVVYFGGGGWWLVWRLGFYWDGRFGVVSFVD